MTKMVIVVRKDLNMRKGKLAGQVGHAVQGALTDTKRSNLSCRSQFGDRGDWVKCSLEIRSNKHISAWISGGSTKIVVSVDSLEDLLKLHEAAKTANIANYLVKDLGRTEFNGVETCTALAIGPGTNSEIDAITGSLPLI